MPPPTSHSWGGLLLDGLLCLGVFFPVISVVTLGLAWWTHWSTGRNSSAVLIPVIGPVCLTCWVLASGHSAWFIPLVWVADPATMMFLWVTPWLLKDYWRYSRWTCLATYRSNRGNHSVTLSLHFAGNYLLVQNWEPPYGPQGVIQTSEGGQYAQSGDDYELTAHDELLRTLRHNDEKTYELVEHPQDSIIVPYPLDGWTLEMDL